MLSIHNINQLPSNLNANLLNLITLRLDQLGDIETPIYILEPDDVISVFGDNYPVRLTTTILTG